MEKEVYALYDSRYTEDEDEAICYTVCDTLNEAIEGKKEDWPDAVIVKETLRKLTSKKYLVIKSEIVEIKNQ